MTLSPLRVLGKGRAARAVLVRIEGFDEGKAECVEKIFRPGLLTRFIYWFFFQSPFPYRLSEDAILSCLHRRKVAAKLMQFHDIDLAVAAPYYVRWDEESGAFVLGAEFIEGVGLQVVPTDSRRVRRFFANYIARPLKLLIGRPCPKVPGVPSEAKRLVAGMRRAEGVFRRCGLVGSGWQVSPLALVSTANFIRKKDGGYVLVDIESGIPSMLVPYYLFRSIIEGRFPYFDDIDEKRLTRFMEERREDLIARFGEEGVAELEHDTGRLIEHTRLWKEGEIALFRRHVRLASPKVRRAIKRARIDEWYREGILDDAGKERFERSKRFFTSGIYIAGILPGRIGRLVRKLIGNHAFREDFGRFFRDAEFRRSSIQSYVQRHTREWTESGRVPENRAFRSLGGKFMIHLFLGRLTPGGLHRFISDGERRKKVAATALFFVISERFQTEYAKYVIFRRIREWINDGRLSLEEARMMKERVEDGSMQEYVRVFGLHFALKFLEPVTSGIKIVGVGWFLKIFVAKYPEMNPHGEMTLGLLKAFALTFLHNPIPVLMMINTSVWRTLITLWRMLSIKRRHISYKVALIVGVIPAFGSLAYPMQMYWRCKELSIFLIKDILAVFSHRIPIYGGKHTLVEIAVVRLADFPAELMEVLKRMFAALKRSKKKAAAGVERPATAAADGTRSAAPESTASQGAVARAGAVAGAREAGVTRGPREESGRKKRFDRVVDEMVAKIWERYREDYLGIDF
jgi:hypothetical protein